MHNLKLLSAGALVSCVVALGTSACAQETRVFDIPAGALGDALNRFAAQSDQQIFYTDDLVADLRTPGLRGRHAPSAGLDILLTGTGLASSQTRPGVIFIRRQTDTEHADTATQLDEVVVTGSLLRSSGPPSSPVLVLDRDALDRRGFGTVAEAVMNLPQNYAGTTTPLAQATLAEAGTSNTVYATGVNLRGLGPASTLVLINGRRLAGTGSRAEFADVSALPSAAVERVDVLLDGASALYGADAVAGVVNVVMRRAFDGQESRVRLAAGRGGAENLQISHLAGRSWSSGSAYLSYEYQTANGLSAYDRRYTVDGDLRPFGGTDHRSFYSAPGNIVAFNPATSAYVTQYAIRPNISGTAQGPADFVPGQVNLLSSLQGIDLMPKMERHSGYGRLRQTFGDKFEITADVRYSRRENDIATTPATGVFAVARANPWFASPTNAASHTVAYSFLRDLGPAQSYAGSESLGLTLGARYQLPADWSIEAYLADAREKADFGLTNRVNSRFLAEALGNVPDDPATPFRAATDGYFNLFGDGTTNGQAVLDFVGSGYAKSHGRSRASSANILLQGRAWRLPGGDLSIAIGGQWRREQYETWGETFLTAIAPRLISSPQRERNISAAFAEARIPIVGPDNARPGLRSLELSLAGRVEEYDDFGTTTNPKVGLLWSPIADFAVRASWGTSFRAGALPQIFDPGGVSATFLNRADGTQALTLLLSGGNPNLKPETSETFTLGFDHRPQRGPVFSVNYFGTRFTDRIAQPVNANFNAALSDPALRPFLSLISPATNAADLALIESYATLPGFSTLYPIETYGAVVDARWVNTGAVSVRGLDLSGRQSWDIGSGAMALDASLSWIIDYESRPTPTSKVQQVAGMIGYPSELRGRLGASWTSGRFMASLHWNHVAEYEDRLGITIDAWNTFDAQLAWFVDAPVLRALQFQLSVQNLFDEDPPFYDAPTGLGFDAGGSSPLGRTIALQLTRRW